MAAQIGVTEQAVQKWETGTIPSAVYACALCDVLNVPLSALVVEKRS